MGQADQGPDGGTEPEARGPGEGRRGPRQAHKVNHVTGHGVAEHHPGHPQVEEHPQHDRPQGRRIQNGEDEQDQGGDHLDPQAKA